jgi:hypothetical protein
MFGDIGRRADRRRLKHLELLFEVFREHLELVGRSLCN